jgi:AcrR family transcriptional regulator
VSTTRERILNTAASLFAERGYECVGINELIDTSGVAKATFYQHFRSKEKLCAEWLRQEAAEAAAEAQALLDDPAPADRKLVRKFDGLRDYLLSSEFRGCPFSNTATVMIEDNTVRKVVHDYKAWMRQFWHALAAQAHPRKPATPQSLGDGWFLLYSGAVTEAQNAKTIWPVSSAKVAALTLCGTFTRAKTA